MYIKPGVPWSPKRRAHAPGRILRRRRCADLPRVGHPERDGTSLHADATEMERLFAVRWNIRLEERRDTLAFEPGFRAEGVTAA